MTYTNQHLYEAKLPIDHLVVVSGEPKPTRTEYVVQIDLAMPAAVHTKYAEDYDQPYTVDDVRENAGQAKGKNLWLLSGGTIVRDQRGRFAIGLRDGNAADAFKFTNIGAGRCDQKLEIHCYEELVSELVLCVKEDGEWVQVQFLPPKLPPLLREVRSTLKTIERWKTGRGELSTAGLMPLSATRIKTIRSPKRGMKNLQVKWTKDGKLVDVERLHGYLFPDIENHTLEFRLPFALDLSVYKRDEVELFFAEGTGYAAWKSKAELRKLDALSMVTPLLRVMLL